MNTFLNSPCSFSIECVIVSKQILFLSLTGGEEIEFDMSFQLFLQTKLANPHYKPEIAAQCTLVNFTSTEIGLEDQLLARVVNVERPDLEAQKQELQEAFNRYKIELYDLEEELLTSLANAPEGKLILNCTILYYTL